MHQAKKILCIIKKNKAKLFNSLSEKNITDNRKFWKILKSMLSNKCTTSEKISSVENIKNKKNLSNYNETAEVLNIFFLKRYKNIVMKNI